jgi:hypothetical protein
MTMHEKMHQWAKAAAVAIAHDEPRFSLFDGPGTAGSGRTATSHYRNPARR